MIKRTLPLQSMVALLVESTNFWKGLLFLTMGTAVFAIFDLSSADYKTLKFMGKEKVSVPGKVLVAKGSNQFDKEAKGEYVYDFEYYTNDSALYLQGSAQHNKLVKEGELVEVEYLAEKPYISRIKGSKMVPVVLVYIFFFILPLAAGIYLLIKAVRKFAELYTLYSEGIITGGKRMDSKFLYVSHQDYRVYQLTFEYTPGESKPFEVSLITKDACKFKNETEPIIYHPKNPKWAMLVNEMPGVIRKGLAVS